MSALWDNLVWAALPLPALMVDRLEQIERVNPAAEMFLNIPSRNMAGCPINTQLTLDIDILASLSRARSSGSVLAQRDASVTPREGPSIICDIQIAPLGDAGGHMMILLQPRQIARQLGRALRVKSAAKTAIGLTDMLAHEIKNPLAGIAGAAQLLEMTLGREDRELTGLILQETRRVVDLLAQVEQFGDLRAPALKPVNVHDILERARHSAQVGAAANMRFTDDYDPSLPEIVADSDQMTQVFSNLFANAAEAAGPKGGAIRLRTFFEPGLRLETNAGAGKALPLHVEISDDGPGIPDALVDSVFEPFVSGRENGSGLGLALVSKIIADHGGAMSLNSRPGLTRFRISLPIATLTKGKT